MDPVHPGEVLMEDFIRGFEITQNRLAVAIGVPPRRINEIVHGKRSIIADTALRLSRYFGTSAEFWLNLQDQYDLDLEGTRSRRSLTPSSRSRLGGTGWRVHAELIASRTHPKPCPSLDSISTRR